MVSDGPFIEAKEPLASNAAVVVADEVEAVAIAKRWPAGGVVEGASGSQLAEWLGSVPSA